MNDNITQFINNILCIKSAILPLEKIKEIEDGMVERGYSLSASCNLYIRDLKFRREGHPIARIVVKGSNADNLCQTRNYWNEEEFYNIDKLIEEENANPN